MREIGTVHAEQEVYPAQDFLAADRPFGVERCLPKVLANNPVRHWGLTERPNSTGFDAAVGGRPRRKPTRPGGAGYRGALPLAAP